MTKMLGVLAAVMLALVWPAQAGGKARIIIDQRTGTVVITEDVRIGTVAVVHGGLVIRKAESQRVLPPGPFAGAGETVVVPRTRIEIQEGKRRRLVVLPANAGLRELVRRLNGLGVGPRDLITILQAIKAAGALEAELVVR